MKDAEKRSIKEEEVRLWMKRLKNAALDISEMWDEFHDNSKPTNGKVKEILSCLDISPKIIMENKMKKMRDQLRKIEEDHRNFKLESDPRVDILHQFAHRETTSKVPKGILSRDNERRRVIASLSVWKDKEGITILPIFGLGGIGKTTLAQLVFNDIHFKDYDHRVRVYVSQDFDLLKIGNTIISQVLKEERDNRDMESINRLLQELLGDKKVLIVLDDLWQKDGSQLNNLKDMLDVSSQMNVLVTTREKEIANKIHTIIPFELIPLEATVCWDIINCKYNTNFESRDDQQQLEEIGRVIAGKCGGLPLAAQALGFMLSRMNLNQWETVSNSDIWNEPFAENSVLPSLKLTYIAMPPHLRLCFAYCAIFPRGHIIAKESLIHQWIALDFIEPSNMFSDIQLGEEYVGQLLGMSFMQHSKLPTTTNKGSALTMHDLAYDLARSVMEEELVVYNANKEIRKADLKYCRYALLTNCCKPLKISTILPTKLRALLFQDCRELGLRGTTFSFSKCLRVLDLTESSFIKFPDSIGHLKQLRFLVAPGIKNRRFPHCITELSKLKYLDFRLFYRSPLCRRLRGLPQDLGNLRDLQYLNLSNCEETEKLPESFRKLTNLMHLDLKKCRRVNNKHVLNGLSKLCYLNLSGCFGDFYYGNIDYICALTNLEQLDLSANFLYSLPECISHLRRLRTLDLSGCTELESLPESIASLDNLELLLMDGCSHDVKEAIGRYHFKRGLEHLKIKGYRSRSFPKWIMSISDYLPSIASVVLQDLPACRILPPLGQLPKLKELNLARLNSVRKITGDLCGGQRAILQLSRFSLSDMQVLEEWNTTYCGEDGTEEFMFPVLHELVIYYCPILRLKPCPPIFHSWKIIDDSNEVLNSGEEGDNFGHFNSSALRTLSVERLSSYCGGWRLLHHLPTIRELDIVNVIQMTSLPESMRQLASLRLLRLSHCYSLSIVPEWLGDLKSLEVLRIWYCRWIKSLPSSIQQLTNLQELEISGNRSLREWCQPKENKMMLAHIKRTIFI